MRRRRRISWRCCRRWWRLWRDPDSDWDKRQQKGSVIFRKCLKERNFHSQRVQMMISHVDICRGVINWFSDNIKGYLSIHYSLDNLDIVTVFKKSQQILSKLYFHFVGTDFLSMTETLKFSGVLSTIADKACQRRGYWHSQVKKYLWTGSRKTSVQA